MTDAENELRRLAEAATPGPWEYDGHRIQCVTPAPVDWADEPQKPSVIWDPNCFDRPKEDRPFIVAANPATVLALLDRIEVLEKQVRPSHPTAEHSQRVVTALEEMLAPLSDGTLGTRDVVGRVAALLERVKTLENLQAKAELSAALGPALDIIREPLLEMGCTFPGGGLIGIAEGVRELVAKAERKGAEEMRRAAAKAARAESDWIVGGSIATRIEDIPLPGDAP